MGSGSTPGERRSVAMFQRLLVLYPRSFRDSDGADAVELFRDRYRDEVASRGTRGVMALWVRTLATVAWHGPAERIHALRTGSNGAGGGGLGDLRFALRSLRASPGFSFGAAALLATGIGATIALFSLVLGVVLRPLPFPEADRLVQLWEESPDLGRAKEGPSPWNFHDWQGSAGSFEAMAAWYLSSGTFRRDDTAEETRIAQVTTDFFRVLGVAPSLGRDFAPSEGIAYGPVILSHRFWTRMFGADPAVVGQTMELSGNTYEVVGVMPPGFDFPDPAVEFWLAWEFPLVYADRPESRSWRFLRAVGRLAAGVSAEEAEAELSTLHEGLARAHPVANRGWTAHLTPLHDEMVGPARSTLWFAFAAVAAVLLLTCANVANLLLARAPARSRELAVRNALGASRKRLTRQLLVENLVLAAIGAGLGLFLAMGLLGVVRHFEAGRIPRLDEVRLDGLVLTFTVGLTLLTSLVFGLAPMLQLTRAGGNAIRSVSAGRSTTARQDGLRSGIVAVQVGLALVLLVGAGLFWTSFDRARSVDMGFRTEGALTFRLSLDAQGQGADGIVRYYDGLMDRLAALPGVVSVGASQTLPINPVGNDFARPYRPVAATTSPAEAPTVQMRIVTPSYFAAAGMRFVRGEPFSGESGMGQPLVAVVNETLARTLWPDGDPVGQSFEIDFREGWAPYLVTGVVADVRDGGPRSDVQDAVFISQRQSPYLAMSVVVRSSGDPEVLIPAVRRAVLAHPPGQPPHQFVAFASLMADATATERFLAVLLLVFAAISLLVAGSGVYGVVAFSVAARTRELGIRLALGAEARDLVLEQAGRLGAVALVGLGAGVLVVFIASGPVESMLYDTHPMDPRTILTVGGLLLAVALVAALSSAIRITGVDPATSLRSDGG